MVKNSAKISWALYDFANSSFSTLVTTFLFSTYFTQAIAPTPEIGTALWGTATGIAGIIIAITSPVVGAIADHTGRRKPWLGFFSILCIVSTTMLYFAKPDTSFILFALTFTVLGTVGLEMGCVFYNSMLAELAPKKKLGKLSGQAWALGYCGGLVCLFIALGVFVNPIFPIFNLDSLTAEPIRASMLLTALWFLIFSWPIFIFTPDTKKTDVKIIKAIYLAKNSIKDTFINIRTYSNVFVFLLSRMVYIDGVNTMFAFGGIYAAGTFGMSFSDILIFGISLNITAGLGSLLFGWIDDYVGSKKTLNICLISLIATTIGVLLAQDVYQFWFMALLMTSFFGPIQSSSRTLMLKIAPANKRNEMFGMYALSGKITSFIGPFLVGAITLITSSQRIGLATVVIFLIIGFIILQYVDEEKQ
jgi:UMF1 family MFS transporter